MDKILEQSIYEVVVLDIGDGIPELYTLLRSCTEIRMPVLEDEYSKAKILQFEREMNLLGEEDVLKRIVREGEMHDRGRAALCKDSRGAGSDKGSGR